MEKILFNAGLRNTDAVTSNLSSVPAIKNIFIFSLQLSLYFLNEIAQV